MTDKTLSELTAATTPLTGSESFYLTQAGADRRATLADILAYIGVVVSPGGGGGGGTIDLPTLPSATTPLASTDLLYLVQAGAPRKTTVADLASVIGGGGGGGGGTVDSVNSQVPDPLGNVELNADQIIVPAVAANVSPATSSIRAWLTALDAEFADVNSAIAGIISGGGTITRPTQQIFTSNGTWTKPSGCVRVSVMCVGGGGGGGTPTAGAGQVGLGASGGGGGTCFKSISVTSITSVAVTVGQGGAGGGSAGTSGSAGGTSSFGTHCSATGGGGGSTLAAGTTVARVLGASGGVGVGGDLNLTGNGADLSVRIDGSAGGGFTPSGGGSYFGGGARGASSGNGNTAGNYGGGGSGGASNDATVRFGGSGGGGIVIVTEYY